uniref:Uncharacterized protein n=1 Tax=Kalanchoe fedtschenkoi TaxID=63787 RepID=A0A7N0ZQR3_KALFE
MVVLTAIHPNTFQQSPAHNKSQHRVTFSRFPFPLSLSAAFRHSAKASLSARKQIGPILALFIWFSRRLLRASVVVCAAVESTSTSVRR